MPRKNSGAAAKKAKQEKERKAAENAESETFVRLSVGGVECEIDYQRLTLGEIMEVEKLSGQHIMLFNWSSGTGQYVLAYLARKRVEPTFSARQAYKLQMDEVFAIDEDGERIKSFVGEDEDEEDPPSEGAETSESSGAQDSPSSE